MKDSISFERLVEIEKEAAKAAVELGDPAAYDVVRSLLIMLSKQRMTLKLTEIPTTPEPVEQEDDECEWCAKNGEHTLMDDCMEHCHAADDGKHEPDVLSVSPADDPEDVLDVNCRHCGTSGSFILDDSIEINW